MNWWGIATAIGTVGLAFVGGLTWRQNRALVKSATEEASASNALIAEVVRDRELRWEPWPSVHWLGSVPGSGGENAEIELTNAGGGPAICCRLVVKQAGNDGWLTPAVDIPAGSTVLVRAAQVLDTGVSVLLSTWTGEDGFSHNVESVGAIFTKDVLGRRYRFMVVKDGSTRVMIEHRDVWRPGDQPVPPWATVRAIWPDYGKPNIG